MTAFVFQPVEAELIALDCIDVDEGRQAVDAAKVAAHMESISKIGLRIPPTVRVEGDGDRVVLVAGAHRLAAMRELGWENAYLPVIRNDQAARLWEVDENLCRAELTPSERATLTARRKQIYEAAHPETVREATLKQNSSSRQVGETGKVDRFTADTATVTGQSERKVQRDAERGAKVCAEAIELISGTRLDTGAFLDRLKTIDGDAAQVEAVHRKLAHRARSNTAQRETDEAKRRNRDADAAIAMRAAAASAVWVCEQLGASDTLRLAEMIDRIPPRDFSKVIRREAAQFDVLQGSVHLARERARPGMTPSDIAWAKAAVQAAGEVTDTGRRKTPIRRRTT